MTDLTGRVAVVSGAGRGIGRAHALHLARLGAAVVVNDIGVGVNGAETAENPASDVVAEISRAGGRATASTDSVATADGGGAIVDLALREYGRLDIVIHNAGIIGAGPVATQPWEDIEAVMAVHLHGAYHLIRAAWPTMAAANFGRIVLTSSGAIFGHPLAHAYAAAKAGIIGLTKSLALEAEAAGIDIKINALAPIGATRMARDEQKSRWGELMDPDAVSAVAAYLASPQCRVSGEAFHGGGGHVSRIVLGIGRGWAKGEPGITAGDIATHLTEVMDLRGLAIPKTTNEMTDFLYQVATGRSATLSGAEIIPTEARGAKAES
ncbi:SDR family NAD(P)-dependent oxidoreductase [Mycolicibacterium pulveris]|uniref:Short-chain dehydrogenase n=1 Tax=Mycolicibacterium pulveris TaxID=36813 RepID=A0A7I7UQV5_MYCPV|nr:SDR family NAD(P)-dependent oxidoreductase [Mycolicibacterium pulveris]MCV6983531.1 SDR family NAD(P)-dependent oxidoreductase [Mycolicibacterium pulveris]BBY83410.1 short-chain dehydrogenase [Mycolicibacterium pulveris]